LHLTIIQSPSIGKDRQRIAREPRLREYVNLNEFVCAARHKATCQFVRENVQHE
jgi:hypothetical protein